MLLQPGSESMFCAPRAVTAEVCLCSLKAYLEVQGIQYVFTAGIMTLLIM